MVIKRKLFSKEVERKKSDKGWDAAGDRVADIVRGKKEK